MAVAAGTGPRGEGGAAGVRRSRVVVGGPGPGAAASDGPAADGAGLGTAAAARAFAEDVSALVRAEVALARSELLAGIRPKILGAAMLAAAGALAGIAALGLLLAAGFALHEVAGLPGWASALIVTAVMLLLAVVLVLVGRRSLQHEVGLETTKRNVQEDIALARRRLSSS